MYAHVKIATTAIK